MSAPGRSRTTYPCRHGSIGKSDVVNTDLMYSVGYIRQICGENERRIYPPRPRRMICLCSGYVPTLHTFRVELCHITIRSGRVDLDCVGDLVATHWLREMNLELDGFRGSQAIVVSWEKLGDDWSRNYELVL